MPHSIKFCWLILIQQFLMLGTFSQEKGYISLSVGSSIPIPPFSNDDVKNKNSGLAKMGGTIHLKYVRRIPKEKLGIALLLKANVNGLNTKSMIDAYYENNPEPKLNWEKKVNGWKEISVQPGIIYSFPLNKKVEIECGLFTGVSYAKSPDYYLKGQGSGNSFGRNYYKEVVFEQDQVHGFAFTTSLQSSMRLLINEKLSLMATLGYNYLKPTFKNVEQRNYGMTRFEPGGPSSISIYHYGYRFSITQNMNYINLSGGLVYKL